MQKVADQFVKSSGSRQGQKLAIEAIDKTQSVSHLPVAARSVFRKRPVKMEYDHNEYHMFRLPSENEILLGGFEDRDDIFGKRKGMTHSPAINEQISLDNKILLIIGLVTILQVKSVYKTFHHHKTVRENYRNSDMVRNLTEDDLLSADEKAERLLQL